jgi:nitroreductase
VGIARAEEIPIANAFKNTFQGGIEMDVFEAVQKRHSTRAYEPTSVPEEKLERILEAARLAPSTGNVQPWHFIIVKNREKRETLAKSGRYARFLAESPIVIVGCGDQKASPNWYKVDVAIAMQNMVLTATGEGLGTCWIGSFNENQVRRLLKMPDNLRVIALMALGYPRETLDIGGRILHLVRRKKSLKKVISLDEYEKNKKSIV